MHVEFAGKLDLTWAAKAPVIEPVLLPECDYVR